MSTDYLPYAYLIEGSHRPILDRESRAFQHCLEQDLYRLGSSEELASDELQLSHWLNLCDQAGARPRVLLSGHDSELARVIRNLEAQTGHDLDLEWIIWPLEAEALNCVLRDPDQEVIDVIGGALKCSSVDWVTIPKEFLVEASWASALVERLLLWVAEYGDTLESSPDIGLAKHAIRRQLPLSLVDYVKQAAAARARAGVLQGAIAADRGHIEPKFLEVTAEFDRPLTGYERVSPRVPTVSYSLQHRRKKDKARIVATSYGDCVERVYAQFREPVRKIFASQRRTSRVAEDLTQTVFLRLLKSQSLAKAENPEHYIYATAWNVLRTELTHRAHEQRLNVSLDSDPDAAMSVNRRLWVDDSTAEVDMQHFVNALRRLTPQQQEVFNLHYIDGLTVAQVSRHTGININTVKKYIAKALVCLHAHYGDDLINGKHAKERT